MPLFHRRRGSLLIAAPGGFSRRPVTSILHITCIAADAAPVLEDDDAADVDLDDDVLDDDDDDNVSLDEIADVASDDDDS